MPEEKIIPTTTDFITSGSNVAIKTYYDEDKLPDTILASIVSGKLFIKMKNSPEHIDYVIDSNGHLLLIISTGDQDKYSIDNNGHLIYTTTE